MGTCSILSRYLRAGMLVFYNADFSYVNVKQNSILVPLGKDVVLSRGIMACVPQSL